MAKTKPETTAGDQPGTDLKTQEGGALATAEDNAYADYAGAGFENQDSSDYAIPFLGILQALSPQLQDPANSHMRQGMLLNTVTGEIFEPGVGVAFVPAITQHSYAEFKPRANGGGYVGSHEVESDVVRAAKEKNGGEFGMLKSPEGNDLIETFYVFGIMIDADGNSFEAVMAFNSTKIKVYKSWMTKAKTIQIALADGRRIPAPLMAHRYRIKTVAEKNNKGAFFNFSIAFDGENAIACRLKPNDELFQKAFAIKGLIESGKARAATETMGGQAEEGGDGGGSPAAGTAKPGEKPVF